MEQVSQLIGVVCVCLKFFQNFFSVKISKKKLKTQNTTNCGGQAT
jgi:hypothetical protein